MQPESASIKVSVVTAVYNGERHLEQCIRSVADQTYQNIEHIVIDGASTDGTPGIIRKYSGNFVRSLREPDQGMYDAINKGLALCTGQLIGILNADDWYEPDAIERVVTAFQTNPSGDVYHGKLARTDEAGTREQVTGLTSDFLDRGMIDHPASFVTRNAYRRFGTYDANMKSAADYELMLRFREKGAVFVFIHHILANFRKGGKSASFTSAKETIAIRQRYGLISRWKQALLLIYCRIKI